MEQIPPPGVDQPSDPPAITHDQFMRLFLQAERELLRYVMALVPNVNDARDIVQETAVALWKAIDKYDRSRPFLPWACRFALNEARLYLRSENRRRRFLECDVAALLEERRLEFAGQLDARREHLLDCLARLPRDQHRLVYAHYFEDEPVEALAARFDKTREAIYKSLQRVREALRQCIQRKVQTEG